MAFEYDLVGKIGSMALIQKDHNDVDYNIFARLGAELKPGMIWVSSGAVEIGRVDYLKRAGQELAGDMDEIKTDYAAQGQAILMENYRRFVRPEYSIRQVLVEHQHFNDVEKREHIKKLLLRAKAQNAIPIVNYNDPVSFTENRRFEIASITEATGQKPVECIDNDETAAVIAELVNARVLLILSSVDGIYLDPEDPDTLVHEVRDTTEKGLLVKIQELSTHCVGASRAGANGAGAKLEFITPAALKGTKVIIGHPRFSIGDLVAGTAPATRIYLG
ncbi:uridylate kinase [Eubacteriales bacterium OttesenSCG-928-M02]|nr:uridylate kinase [Eubacteriales bacterium OttesenSCG-928-M02]